MKAQASCPNKEFEEGHSSKKNDPVRRRRDAMIFELLIKRLFYIRIRVMVQISSS